MIIWPIPTEFALTLAAFVVAGVLLDRLFARIERLTQVLNNVCEF